MSTWRGRKAILVGVFVVLLGAHAMTSGTGASHGSLGSAATETATEDHRQIEAVFDAYRLALSEGDTETAVALVDRSTHQYLETLKELALNADRERLGSVGFVERLLVVTLRHTLSSSEINALTLHELIDLALRSEWLSASTLTELRIGEVAVEGDEGSAEALTPQGLSLDAEGLPPLRYRFVREGDVWKFRFAQLVTDLGAVVAQFTANLGGEDDALIFMLVENLSGRAVLPEVWDVESEGALERPGPTEETSQTESAPPESGPPE